MPHKSRTQTKHLAPCRCPAIGFFSLPTPHGSSTPSNKTPQTTTSPTERHRPRHPSRICTTETLKPHRRHPPRPRADETICRRNSASPAAVAATIDHNGQALTASFLNRHTKGPSRKYLFPGYGKAPEPDSKGFEGCAPFLGGQMWGR